MRSTIDENGKTTLGEDKIFSKKVIVNRASGSSKYNITDVIPHATVDSLLDPTNSSPPLNHTNCSPTAHVTQTRVPLHVSVGPNFSLGPSSPNPHTNLEDKVLGQNSSDRPIRTLKKPNWQKDYIIN